MSDQAKLSRRQTLTLLGGAASSLALTGCQTAAAKTKGLDTVEQAKATAFLDVLAQKMIELSPESATSLGVDTGANSGLRKRLGDRSPHGQAQIAALMQIGIKGAALIDAERVDPATRTSLAVVNSAFSVAADGFALPYGDVAVGGWRNTPYVVIQNVGAYLDVPRFLDSDHPVETASDAEAYLERLGQFAALLDGELERIKDARGKGLVPPAFLLDKAIRQLELTIKDASNGGGGMADSLKRRTDAAGIVHPKSGVIHFRWEDTAKEIVIGSVVPALQRQLEELKAQRSVATMDAGLLKRPHGEEWYAWGLRASTTTRRTPDDLHAMGLDTLKELQGQMEPILRSLGFTQGTVGQRMTALGKDPRFGFTNDDKGRVEIIKLMEDKIAFIRTKLPQAFRTLMKGNLEIKRLPPAEEDGAPGAYGGAGSKDGKIPGKIWLNLGDVGRHSRYSLPTLAFHEGIPGHVWQGEYANALPLIRTLLAFNAYSEGWALYAETLGDELGAYDGDPVGRLGYLQSIAFRACRLVVDTGLHAKGWSREQAIQWFAETNGSGLSEVTPEVDRYCSWPGQACGYKVGHSEILRLRAGAKAELGAKYDLRDFDDAVVTGGNVPLDVLAQNMARYVASAKAG